MSAAFLTHIDSDGIVTLTLNRPEVRNAFDDVALADITEELRRLGGDSAVRAVIVAAAGESFCAGADLKWMRRTASYTEAENYEDAMRLAGLMATLNSLPKPTIAKVQGAAFGGGVGIIACCDVAIAVRNAKFSLSEARLGLVPGVISPYVVSAIGERQARRYFVTAEVFDAEQARRIGLVHEVVEAADLDDRVAALSAQLMQNGPEAMGAAKRLAQDVARGRVDQYMIEDTARRIAGARAGAEGREGIAAFLEKRPPSWRKG